MSHSAAVNSNGAAKNNVSSSKLAPRELYPTDIPVLNELASLIGSLDLDTQANLSGSTARLRPRDTDRVVAEELAQVFEINSAVYFP